MARDVEFNVTASDKTSSGLASVERRFAATQAKLRKQQDETDKSIGKSLLQSFGKVAPKLTTRLTEAFSAVSQYAVPIIAGIGVAAAPLLGAAISGAIIGAAGVGGVIGGVLLVSKDARVAAAGKALGATLLSSLQQDATPFITPVLNAVDTIKGAFDGLRDNFRSIFANASRYVAPLTSGLVGFLNPVIRGFDALVAKAAPVIAAIKVGFAQVGSAIGDLFESLADNGKEAGVALTFVFTGIATAIRITGQILNALTEAFGFMLKSTAGFARLIPGLDGALKSMGETTSDTEGATIDLTTAFQSQGDEAADLTASLDAATEAVRGTYQANNDLYASTTDVARAMADASKKIGENGKGLSVNTEKGRANRDALSSVAGQLQRNYENYVKVNGAGTGAQKVADKSRTAFEKLAVKAGLSAGQAHKLAGELLNIPESRKTKIEVQKDEAARRIAAVKKQMEGLRNKTVKVDVIVNSGKLDSVENRLNRTHGGAYAATSSWSAVDGNSGGMARTGGASPVKVSSSVSVNLDGAPFRAYTADAVRDSEKRQAWRTKVGTR